ncbi:MAG: Holliday junction branch migration protein RuvA [Lachnospiraceae bacterium]|nr:Holliday junction branch migration protein RuvA [Lachnospiraceae bacterium]
MLAYIKGTLTAVTDDGIIIENNGIGYDIKTPDLSGQLPAVGNSCTIYTYLYVREDMVCLYGFSSKQQLKTFKLLITVSGIGPKAAMGILSTLTVDELNFAILSDDSKTISKTPGIGPKGAKRLIIELKDKLDLGEAFESFGQEIEMSTEAPAEDVMSLTAQGLVSLGYSNSEALRAIRAVNDAETMDAETLLSEALKKLLTF